MREMGFMEKLLDGAHVEWKSLASICKIETGKLNANAATEDGAYMFFTTAKEVSKIDKYRWDTEALLIAGNANVGDVKHYSGKFEAYQRTYVLTNFSEKLNVRYLFHIVSNSLKQYLEDRTNSAAMTYIVLSTLENFPIPIPCPDNPKKSLEIQAEIVRILDAMTAHTAELTAELTARKKQYDYYRDKLLSFEEDVYEFPLTDICTSIADGDHQAPPQTSTGINFVTISNISKNGFIDFSKTKYVPDDYYKNLASKRKPRFGDVLYTVVGSIGIPVFIDFEKEFTFQRHVAILRFKTELVNPKYVFHFMRSRIFFNKANSVAMGAAQKTITLGTLGKLKISLPSLERQNNIVAILDKFDSLANSITDGLPREIELRQKQYAYYRDLLLSFPAAQAA